MKEEEIKPLLFVEEFSDYFVKRARRVLKLKNSEFKTASIDVHPERGTIWVWFHTTEKVIGRAQFNFDGRCYQKLDNRKEAK